MFMSGLHQNIIALDQNIIALDRKIDGLYAAIEQLNQQVAMLIARDQERYQLETSLPVVPQSQPLPSEPATQAKAQWQSSMTHKDILLDDNDWEQVTDIEPEPVISDDLQVRRLTAQVTAAYNRIAALEEQLLARRSQRSF